MWGGGAGVNDESPPRSAEVFPPVAPTGSVGHLDYARPESRLPFRALARFATVSLLYPLFVAGSLYGEWLIAWLALGHQPRPGFDDPKSISGSAWMHAVTSVLIMGILIAAPAGIALNIAHIALNPVSRYSAVARCIALLLLWPGTIAFLRWDPMRVFYWWMD